MRRPLPEVLKPITRAEFESVYGRAFKMPECRVHGWHRSQDGRVMGAVLSWSENCWGLALVREEFPGVWCVRRLSRGLATEYAANLLLQVAAMQILEPM